MTILQIKNYLLFLSKFNTLCSIILTVLILLSTADMANSIAPGSPEDRFFTPTPWPTPGPTLTTSTSTSTTIMIPLCPPPGRNYQPGQCALLPTNLQSQATTPSCLCCPDGSEVIGDSCKPIDPCVIKPIYKITARSLTQLGVQTKNAIRTLQGNAPSCLENLIRQNCHEYNGFVSAPNPQCVAREIVVDSIWDLYYQRVAAYEAGNWHYYSYLNNLNNLLEAELKQFESKGFTGDYCHKDLKTSSISACGANFLYNNYILGPGSAGYKSSALNDIFHIYKNPKGFNPFSFYLDADCNKVTPTYDCGLQGSYYAFQCPISLQWTADNKVGDSLTVTQFPLDPRQEGRWFTWHGSADTPLLVYDPEHRGEIVNASQLFGNHSFGREWKDGYAALASLDLDQSGKIDGTELSPLGLWFDANSNGKSEAGEVKSVLGLGIKNISYSGKIVTSENGNLFMANGYERHFEGHNISGASVDWYARSFGSKEEAMIKLQLNTIIGSKEIITSPTGLTQLKSIEPQTIIDSKIDPMTNLSGTWKWSASELKQDTLPLLAQNITPVGILAVIDTDQGLHAFSFLESELPVANGQATKHVLVFPLVGKKQHTKAQGLTAELKSEGEGTQRTQSKLKLSLDGKILFGESRAEIGKNSAGKPIVIEYTWTAVRI